MKVEKQQNDGNFFEIRINVYPQCCNLFLLSFNRLFWMIFDFEPVDGRSKKKKKEKKEKKTEISNGRSKNVQKWWTVSKFE